MDPRNQTKGMKRVDFSIAPYLRRSNLKASWQILITICPVALLWLLVAKIDQTSLNALIKGCALMPVLVLLALFSTRAFSLMHDCGHNSLFKSRSLNRSLGFLLGVLNAIPQHPWSRDHAFHHQHNGNWEIYRGPIDVLTVQDFQSLSKENQFFYAISRHWMMLFPGGFYYLVIKPRLALFDSIGNFFASIMNDLRYGFGDKHILRDFDLLRRLKSNQSGYGNTAAEVIDLIANNVFVLIGWILMSRWLGAGLFWSCYSIVMTISAAIFICIFFVQHNFKGSYANRTDSWDLFLGAVEGSSNLDLPRWLNWFLADISFHSIHHLCERIPNYNLRACHLQNQEFLKESMTLKLADIPSCFSYILWDAKSQQLTTVAAIQKQIKSLN